MAELGSSQEHRRCRYKVTSEKLLNMAGPTGCKTKEIRVWQTRECLICGATNSRWMPKGYVIGGGSCPS